MLWRQTVLRLADRIGHALTQWLALAFGEGLSLVVDTDKIDTLSSRRAAVAPGVLPGGGLFSPNRLV